MTPINGVIVTPMTPFDRSGALDLSVLPKTAIWLKQQGVGGMFCLGTWGGFPLLTFEERQAATDAVIRAANDAGLTIIVNIGTPCLQEAVSLVERAKSEGADAIASTVPIYHSGAGYYSIDDYRRYFGALLQAADEMPLYLYNNPRTTGVLLSPSEFVVLVKDGLAGVKDGSKSEDWIIEAQELLAENDLAADIVPGNTTAMAYLARRGLSAVTSGAALTFPKLAVDVISLYGGGDSEAARQRHDMLTHTRKLIAAVGNPAMTSYGLMRAFGASLGYARLPWSEAPTDLITKLVDDLRAIPGIEAYWPA